jgi:ATP-dependent helicase HrpA
MTGVTVSREAWDLDRIPEHLRMTYRVEDEKGRILGEGKDLDSLKQRLATKTKSAIAKVTSTVERTGLTSWDLGTLPRSVEGHRDGHVVKGYPALVDGGDTVAIKILGTESEQRRAMWTGTRRLLMLTIPSPNAYIAGWLTNESKLALSGGPHSSVPELLADAVGGVVDKLMTDAGGPAWDEEGFARLRDTVRADLVDVTLDVLAKIEKILGAARTVEQGIKGTSSLALVPALTDIKDQLRGLVYPGFITDSGWRRLPDIVRYLRAAERRLEKLPHTHNRDRELMGQIHELREEYDAVVAQLPGARRHDDDVVQVRWMLEELRVSYFAQTLGTPYPVSDKRVYRAIDNLIADS